MNYFFKKVNPAQKVWASGLNAWVSFSRIDDEIGVVITQNPQLAHELRQLVSQGVGGITEINEVEFNELQAKKKEPSPTPSREEWRLGPKLMTQTHSPGRSTAQSPAVPAVAVKQPEPQIETSLRPQATKPNA